MNGICRETFFRKKIIAVKQETPQTSVVTTSSPVQTPAKPKTTTTVQSTPKTTQTSSNSTSTSTPPPTTNTPTPTPKQKDLCINGDYSGDSYDGTC